MKNKLLIRPIKDNYKPPPAPPVKASKAFKMPKNSNALRAKKRESRLKREKEVKLAEIALCRKQRMEKLLSVFGVLEGAHMYKKDKSRKLATGILGFLSFHDINALAGTCTELRTHVHDSGVLDQPHHVKAWVDMHAKHFEAREKKYGVPDVWSRNWECMYCGCNSHHDVVGDLTCFCETCKYSGCEMMWVESEASKLERRMGLGNNYGSYDSDNDSCPTCRHSDHDYCHSGHGRCCHSGYNSSRYSDSEEDYDPVREQQIMDQVVKQQLAMIQKQQLVVQQLPSAW